VIERLRSPWSGLCLVLWFAIGTTSATESPSPAAELVQLLSPIQRLKAEFTQTVVGARRDLVQSSEGYLRIARPQQFKWVSLKPYPQTIVTVGDKLYVYDPDLRQVQVKRLDQALAGTPALVLLGTSADIAAQFDVTREQTEDGVQFVLVPKNRDAVYTEIRMTFVAKRLERIEILDSLGQVTDVDFHNLEINGPLAADEFEFSIPPDTDLIGDVGPKPA
jgi:outer membrane lipoprotein carrier protein